MATPQLGMALIRGGGLSWAEKNAKKRRRTFHGTRVHLHWASRALFIWLYRCCPRILDAITIVRPETVVRWREWVLPLTGDGSPAPLGADRGSARRCATSFEE